VALGLGDQHCETVGLPAFLERRLERRLAERGIHLRLGNVRAGLFNGVIVEDIRLDDAEMAGWELFSAARVRCEFGLAWHPRQLRLDAVNIEQGRLRLPWFPEMGEEGRHDLLGLEDLECRLTRSKDGTVRIEYLSGQVGGIQAHISGMIVLPTAPEPYGAAPAMRPTAISARPFIVGLSPSFRTQAAVVFAKIGRERAAGLPRCQADMLLRLDDPAASTVRAKVELPRISHGRLTAHNLHGEVLLADGEVALNGLHVQFSEDEGFQVDGTYNLLRKSMTGTVRGRLSPARMAPLIDQEWGEPMIALLAGEDTPAEIVATLAESLPAEGKFRGTLAFSLPRFRIDTLVCRHLKGEIHIPEDGRKEIFLPRFQVEIEGGGELSVSGRFDAEAVALSGHVEGNFPGRLVHELPQAAASLSEVPLDLRGGTVRFSGTVERWAPLDRRFRAELDLAIDRMRFRDAAFTDVVGWVSLGGEIIRGRRFSGRNAEGNALAGRFDWQPAAKHFASEFSCRGIPRFLPLLLPVEDRHHIEGLYAELSWPADGSAVESEGSATVIGGEDPFFLLTADIVMQDFAWRGVSFRHGAARLHLDAAGLLLMPAIILERPEGRALLSLAYDQRDDAAPAIDSPQFSPGHGPRRRLVIDFDSTFSGDAFLACLYPEWQPGSGGLDLAHPLPVRGGGIVDYLSPDDTRIEARVRDAAIGWRGIPLTGTSSRLVIGRRCLELPDLRAKACHGDLSLAYRFDYGTATGQVEATLQHASFPAILAAIGHHKDDAQSHGELSGHLAADLSQELDGPMLLHGGGTLAVREADLWDIPVFSELSRLLRQGFGFGDWGSITRLDADFALLGDHLHADPVRTDGTVIALEAQGDYVFASGNYDFTLRTRLLRESLPMHLLTRLIDPVAWLFETRVRRVDGTVSWEQIGGVRKLLTPLEHLVPERQGHGVRKLLTPFENLVPGRQGDDSRD
jgi:hypothetical protein